MGKQTISDTINSLILRSGYLSIETNRNGKCSYSQLATQKGGINNTIMYIKRGCLKSRVLPRRRKDTKKEKLTINTL